MTPSTSLRLVVALREHIDALIWAGDVDIVVAGGMENMSRGPYLVPGARWGYRLWNQALVDGTVNDGLWCAFHDVHVGVHADRVARQYSIGREEQDAWAYRSHVRAHDAIRAGRLKEEIVPVEVPQRKGPPVVFDTDESPRPDNSPEKLAALKPVFLPDGTITAGNAPGINDGAAALVLMSRRKAEELGLKPLATIVSQGWVSRSPEEFPLTPYPAAQAALRKAGLSFADVDLIEVNEAFAAVALVNMKLGDWPEEKVNVNGGAVALGHPIGASGARILLTLALELRRRGGGLGLACLCCWRWAGGGCGHPRDAVILPGYRSVPAYPPGMRVGCSGSGSHGLSGLGERRRLKKATEFGTGVRWKCWRRWSVLSEDVRKLAHVGRRLSMSSRCCLSRPGLWVVVLGMAHGDTPT